MSDEPTWRTADELIAWELERQRERDEANAEEARQDEADEEIRLRTRAQLLCEKMNPNVEIDYLQRVELRNYDGDIEWQLMLHWLGHRWLVMGDGLRLTWACPRCGQPTWSTETPNVRTSQQAAWAIMWCRNTENLPLCPPCRKAQRVEDVEKGRQIAERLAAEQAAADEKTMIGLFRRMLAIVAEDGEG